MRVRAVLIVALVLSVSIVGGVSASTPVASPVATPDVNNSCESTWRWCDIPGYQIREVNEFRALGSEELTGDYYLAFGVAQFDSVEHASAGLSIALENAVTNISTVDGPAENIDVVPSSIRSLGDGSFAYAGRYFAPSADRVVDYAAVAVVSGFELHLGFGVGIEASPLSVVADALESSIKRQAERASATPQPIESPEWLLFAVVASADLPHGWSMVGTFIYR